MLYSFRVKFLLVVVLLVFAPLAHAAKGPQGVGWTVHNFGKFNPDGTSGTGEYRSDDEDEICIFCHTPHGGSLDAPLWNRSLPTSQAGWTYYNSATLSDAANLTRTGSTIRTQSLLCLSCHDGSIAINRVINGSNDGTTTSPAGGEYVIGIQDPDFEFLPYRGRIGGSPVFMSLLGEYGFDDQTGQYEDDHPISFDYYQAKTTGGPSGGNDPELHEVATAEGAGVRFFNDPSEPNSAYLECSSCHDPHVNYVDVAQGGDPAYTPFLITTNNGSHLCLACHNK